MSLNSEMQKIISFTQKFSDSLNPDNLINFKIPGGRVANLLGYEDGEEITSLSGLLDAVERANGLVATGANIVRCAGIMGMDGFGGFLGQMAAGSVQVIAAITDEIFQAIAVQIDAAINQVISAITNIISALQNLWTSILLLAESISLWFKDLAALIDLDFQLDLDRKNCKDMYAAIAGCLLNKFLGPYLDEFKNKVINEINEVGNDFNSMLYDELQDARTFAAYAEHESFLLKKASLQINGLNARNLTQSTY